MSDVNYCLLSISLVIMLDIINTMLSDGSKDLDTTRLRLEAIRKEASEFRLKCGQYNCWVTCHCNQL